ncbi:MAG: Gfo/Idh/MocA family oxidoreductase [Verrucomicrobia bacterium]|nr:Gfo/Idh/MocA family oxidoreductase [Verrucomicrobiota bacterium]
MKQNQSTCSRREFLRTAVAAGLALPGLRVLGANDDIRVAVIGLGNKGKGHVAHFSKLAGVRLVALCDVDPERLEAQKSKAPFCATDPRRILERKDVDAVVIATPNHWHALLAVWACEAGKDVYVEKPVSHNVWEGRQIVRAAARHNRIVQAGTQYRSDPGLREASQFIRQGNIGKVLWGHVVWYEFRPSIGRKEPHRPDWLDYDLYCGPAPLEPLTRPRLHYDWHWVWSTGDGDLGNSGIHAIDLCRFLAGIEGLPPRVLSLGGRFGYEDAGETPNTQLTALDYQPAPILVENRNLPMKKDMKAMDQQLGIREGVILQCEHGYFAGMRGGGAVFDNDRKRIKQFPGDGGGQHAANFIAAVRSRKASDLNAPIAQGHVSSSACHLGNISYRLGAGAPLATAKSALAESKLASETLERVERHLAANEVDLNKTPLRVGRRLSVDTQREEISDADARSLARGQYRAPYVLKEVA